MQLNINAVGDISLGDHPVCIGHGVRSVLEEKGAELFSDIRSALDGADINLCNLECVVSNKGLNKYLLSSFEMRGDPQAIPLLKQTGFNLLGVANNHSLQHGTEAFSDMVDQCSKAGVSLIGIDTKKNRTAIHEIVHEEGIKSAVFAISIRPEEWIKQGPIPYSLRSGNQALLEEIDRIRERYKGFLVCSIHWGLEFLDYPSPSQTELGRKLIDHGVDVVFGHHSHVVQPIERYKNGLIFYSLGNFLFDLWPEITKLSAIAKVSLKRGFPADYKIVPVKIGPELKLRNADAEDSALIFKMMSWEKNYLSRTDLARTDNEYETEYIRASRSFRYSSYGYFLSNIKKYSLNFLVQSLGRTALRRLVGK